MLVIGIIVVVVIVGVVVILSNNKKDSIEIKNEDSEGNSNS